MAGEGEKNFSDIVEGSPLEDFVVQLLSKAADMAENPEDVKLPEGRMVGGGGIPFNRPEFRQLDLSGGPDVIREMARSAILDALEAGDSIVQSSLKASLEGETGVDLNNVGLYAGNGKLNLRWSGMP